MIQKKDDINTNDFLELHPNLLRVYASFIEYAKEFELPAKITSIKSDRGNIQTASMTHESGRAIDLSSQGWSEFHIQRIQYHLNNLHEQIAAISFSDKKARAVIYHDAGYGSHFHLQVRA